MIVVVALDPVLGLAVHGESPSSERVALLEASAFTPAGRGLRVALVCRSLGQPVRVLSVAGGETGRALAAQLERDGIESSLLPVIANTPIEVTWIPPDPAAVLHSRAVPVALSAADCRDLLQRFGEVSARANLVVLAGDSPSGAADFLFAKMLTTCRQRGLPAVVDAGPAALLEVRDPCWIRTGSSTWAELAPHFDSLRPSPDLAVVCTDGAAPVTLRKGGVELELKPPEISARPHGDAAAALVGGMAVARAEGVDVTQAVRFGIASAAAELTRRTALAFTRADVDGFLNQVGRARRG